MDSNIAQFIGKKILCILRYLLMYLTIKHCKMNYNWFKFLKNGTKPENLYYLVLFVNHTKPGTVLIETVPSGEYLYYIF